MNELIEYIRKLNAEFGYQAIWFRRMWDEKNKLYWMIWYGQCHEDGRGRMAFWEDTHTASKIVTVIAKMHRLKEA
jgi:hypothetical protein